MKNFLLLTFLFSSFIGFTQDVKLDWAIGGNGYANNIKQDSEGNFYLLGNFTDSIRIANHTIYRSVGVYHDESFCYKLDRLGNFIWVKQFIANTGRSIDVDFDSQGNVYIVGIFTGLFQIEDQSFETGPVFEDGNLMKLDRNGNFIWFRNIGNGGFDEGTTNIEVEGDHIYVAGYFESTGLEYGPYSVGHNGIVTDPDGYILKTDLNGNAIWLKSISAGSATINNINLNSDNVIISGNYSRQMLHELKYDGVLVETYSIDDFFYLVLNQEGELLYSNSFEGVQNSTVEMVTDKYSYTYLTGEYYVEDLIIEEDTIPGSGLNQQNNIFLIKMDPQGNVAWYKTFGGSSDDYVDALQVDQEQNIYIGGSFRSDTLSLNEINYFQNNGSWGKDAFVAKLNGSGDPIFSWSFGAEGNDYCSNLFLDANENIFISGSFSDTLHFPQDLDSNYFFTDTSSSGQTYLAKFSQNKIFGKVYKDLFQNCIQDFNEINLSGIKLILDDSLILMTRENGIWHLRDLPVGNHTITIDTTDLNWASPCFITQSFEVLHPDSITNAPSFGLDPTNVCITPNVSINMPLIRPCFTAQKIYVSSCNQSEGTDIFGNPYTEVLLDDDLIFESSSVPSLSLGNNIYRFNHPGLYPGQCVDFTIFVQVNCDVLMGKTLCLEASLYPEEDCIFDTIRAPNLIGFTPCDLPWDQSDLSIDSWCQNDSLYFKISNTSEPLLGDMNCFSPVRLAIDGEYLWLDSIRLIGGSDTIYAFVADGRTWRMEVNQHPLHPGNSNPNATIEACGDIDNWTSGLVSILPEDDADPNKDIYCGIVTGSYDPNDKRGFPLGVSAENFITSNQDLEYIIRFQNTGTDTAFTVVIRDTLDTDLNIFTVDPGVASHPYSFRMYGPRVLEWTFSHIMLPDSTTNEQESHGFITFSVAQNPNLEEGTLIENDADIYFDFNEPIITNMTNHTVNYQYNKVNKIPVLNKKANEVKIYPNPSSALFYISMSTKFNQTSYRVTNLSGQLIESKSNISGQQFQVDLSGQAKGMYFLELMIDNKKEVFKLVKE